MLPRRRSLTHTERSLSRAGTSSLPALSESIAGISLARMDPGAALFLAAKKGDATRVRALFASGADVHVKPVR